MARPPEAAFPAARAVFVGVLAPQGVLFYKPIKQQLKN